MYIELRRWGKPDRSGVNATERPRVGLAIRVARADAFAKIDKFRERESKGRSNWILHRKWKYSICCLRDTKNRKRCLKQHLKYFNFRSKIQLDHRVKGDSGRGRPRSPAQTVPPWSESLRPRRDQKKGIGVVGQRKCAAGGQGCNSLHFLSDVDLVKSLQVFQEILTPTLMYFYLLLAPDSEASSPWYPLENVSNPPPRAFA